MRCISLRLAALLLLVISLLPAQPALAATHVNPTTITAPVAGTVKLYIKGGSAAGVHTIVLTNQRTGVSSTVVTPGGELDGLLLGLVTTVDVVAGDNITVEMWDGGYHSPGWEDPVGTICRGGWNFANLLPLVGSSPIISSQCWEDYQDMDYNDLALVFAYDPATIDTTAPTTIATLTGPLGNLVGGRQWYLGPTQLTLSASDPDDPVASTTLDGAPYAPKTYSAPGQNPFTFFSIDSHNNAEALKNGEVWIDADLPLCNVALAGTMGANGWYRSAVQATVNSSDATSGVGAVQFNGAPYAGTVTIAAQGSTNYNCRACDVAGNCANGPAGSFQIDSVAPTINASSALPNANGWHNADVTVTYACADATSGVQTCAGPQTVSSEGAAQNTTGNATDQAGNPAATTTVINLDKTLPTINASLSAPANAAGWHNADVTVSYTCADTLSGVQTCTASQTISSEGAAQSRVGNATDRASNTAATATVINLDKTSPTISVSLSTPPNAVGWHTSTPVQVTLAASDSTSGLNTVTLDGTPYVAARAYSAEGVTHITYAATDVAGNAASGSATLQIDTAAPAVLAHLLGTAGLNGWYTSPVQLGLSGNDAASGLAALELNGAPYSGPVIVSNQGVTNFNCRGMDVAGNWAALQTGSFQIDTAVPHTALALDGPAGDNGWYRGPVTVTLTADDTTSGVGGIVLDSVPYTAPRVYAVEGSTTLAYTATDNAGNPEPPQVFAFQIDSIAPTVTVTLTGALGSNGWYTSPVTVTLTADDATAGLAGMTLDGTPYTAPRLYAVEGVSVVPAVVRDAAGNVTAPPPVNFQIDTQPPTTTIRLDGLLIGDTFIGPVLVTLHSADATSGVNQILLDGTPYTWPRLYALGAVTATFQAVDAAGNVEPLKMIAFTSHAPPAAVIQPTVTPTPTETPTPTATNTPQPTRPRPTKTVEPTQVEQAAPAPTATPMPTPTSAPLVVAAAPVQPTPTPTSTPADTRPPELKSVRGTVTWPVWLFGFLLLGVLTAVSSIRDPRPVPLRRINQLETRH